MIVLEGRSSLRSLCLALAVILSASCTHRELVDMNDVHYLKVYVDKHIRNIDYGVYNPALNIPEVKTPKVIRAVLCDPVSGKVVSERYLQHGGTDANGEYLDGYLIAKPGRYMLMAYNFDTEATHVKDRDLYYQALAYTNPISGQALQMLPSVYYSRINAGGAENGSASGSSSGNGGSSSGSGANGTGSPTALPEVNVRYEPDHFFTVAQEVDLTYSSTVDTVRIASGEPIVAKSMVYSYYMQVKVKGAKYISTASAILSGMAPSSRICDWKITTDPCELFFQMTPTEEDANGIATLYTTFNTFGKIDDATSNLTITFDIITVDGRYQTVEINLSDLFKTDLVINNRWIIIDHIIIEIKEPPSIGGGGGFQPGVDDWKNEQEDIII